MMRTKPVYQLSARQILLLAFSAAAIAVATAAAAFGLYQFYWKSGAGPGITFAEQPPANISDPSLVSDEQNNIEVYRAISPGVAFISTTSLTQSWWGDIQEGRGNGSGSVLDTQGHILTNYHVIERAQRITVNFGGDQVYPATLVGGDPDTDLAVIKVDAPASAMTVVPMGDSDRLVVGQKVLAIGNPFGLDRTLTTGVISGLQRPIRSRPVPGAPTGRPIDAAIQTDASINPGNSGGPLLDRQGRMIGINSQILSPAGGSVGVGFAVPVNTAKRVVPQLIKFGEVRRPKLGADIRAVEDLISRGYRLPIREGLLVAATLPGGAAANAGIRGLSRDTDGSTLLGDVIIAIDGEKMNNIDDLYRLLDRKQFGETIRAEVYRNGERVMVPIRLTQSSVEGGGGRRTQN
ncbi:MAG TPA: trypsin-like peptidase domain-containing protein [Pyrinomonadaceae bacterium]|nr:trypsin-like peptidase domain-containing protein [Pyrinomonadaceae bacterium]